MKVSEIVKETAKILNLKEVIDSINENETDNEELQCMLMAVNFVNNNIASNYIELIGEKEVYANNTGVIAFKDICKNGIIEIKSITSKRDGDNVSFTIKSDGVHVDSGEYVINFSYFPVELSFDDEINYYTKMNVNLFAMGVVSEYLFLKGDIEEAHAWDKKFKQSLMGVLRFKRSLVLPKRRWG